MQTGNDGVRKPELRLSRVFDAPRSLVWKAWSKAEYVKRWFTPAPLTTPRCEVDLRTRGIFYLVMKRPDGVELPMDARFVEVVPLERIVFARPSTVASRCTRPLGSPTKARARHASTCTKSTRMRGTRRAVRRRAARPRCTS